jgi:hypothetical protein
MPPFIDGRGVDLVQGEYGVLKASGQVVGAVVNATGTPIVYQGERDKFLVLCDITASLTAAGDTLDVYVDVLGPDGVTWINAIHFTQQAGNGAAKKMWAILTAAGTPGTAVVDVTTDAASGVVRPYLYGAQMRARWTQVQVTDVRHTFSVTVYADTEM